MWSTEIWYISTNISEKRSTFMFRIEYYSEVGVRMFMRNVDTYLPTNKASLYRRQVISTVTVMLNSKPTLPLNFCFLFIVSDLICPLSYWIMLHQLQRSNMGWQERCVGKNEINLLISFILNRLKSRIIAVICRLSVLKSAVSSLISMPAHIRKYGWNSSTSWP
jgi:uncharacterized Tic20 family protein